MSSKINIWPIVRDHLGTLEDNRTKKISFLDLAVFFGIPVIAAVPLAWVDYALSDSIRNVLGAAMAVFVGLLFNVLLLIYDVVSRREASTSNQRRREFLKEVYSNLAFAILIAVVTLANLVSTAFVTQPIASLTLSGIVYYLSGVFSLTLLMVLKRIHALFADQFAGINLQSAEHTEG